MALSWWDGVDIEVEAGFGSDPLGTITWTDITDDVRDIRNGTVGRRSEFVPFGPSSVQIVLANAERQYDPDYATGPYFGDLNPMTPIRIVATVSATVVTILSGFALGWPQQWGHSDATSTITVADGARFQQNNPLPPSVHEKNVTDDAPLLYWPMQDADSTRYEGKGANPVDMFPGQEAFLSPPIPQERVVPLGASFHVVADASIPSALNTPTTTIDPPKAVEIWLSGDWSDSAASSTSVHSSSLDYFVVRVDFTGIYVEYSNDTDNRRLTSLGGFKLTDPLPDGPHLVALRADTTNMYLIVDGDVVHTETLTVGSTALSSYTAPTVYLSLLGEAGAAHLAVYDATPTNADLEAHYLPAVHAYGYPIGETTGTRMGRALDDAGWPSALRDIDAGTQVVGPYFPAEKPVLKMVRELEATEQGMVFTAKDGKLTFLDRQTLWTADTGVVFTDDEAAADVRLAGLRPDGNTVDTIKNVVTVSYRFGGITRRDDTSITSYGTSSESVTSPMMPTGAAASQMASYILRTSKDPQTRYTSMRVSIRGQQADATRILDTIQRSVGDVVTIERTPVNITPQIVKKAMIQGYRFNISKQDWVIDFYLSPAVLAAEDAPYLTLGDATDGQIGVTASNLIPA